MEQEQLAVGLDIGTTKIVAMLGTKNEYGKLEIVGVGKSKSQGVHRGVVNNITQTIQSIQAAAQEAEAISGKKITSVVVGIAGQHIRSLHHSDYITRTNADEVIDEADIERLKNQVLNLSCFLARRLFTYFLKSIRWMDKPKSKNPLACMAVG
jgi:cell division protein FtsA